MKKQDRPQIKQIVQFSLHKKPRKLICSPFDYCFEGIPENSIVAIGTVGGGPRRLIDRKRFETGLFKMVEVLKPHTILVYGSANGDCFNVLRLQEINVVSYQSKTAKVFEGRKQHE